mmetsp:Transcript_40161/g.60842  ORF Transcript_40161/g.60842 Transcript_40161/m.60842 type:complete len:121 (+) Transcript_40161:192-554(+)
MSSPDETIPLVVHTDTTPNPGNPALYTDNTPNSADSFPILTNSNRRNSWEMSREIYFFAFFPILLAVGILVLSSSIVTIGPGEVGVAITFGNAHRLEQGVNSVAPWVTHIERISTKTQKN